MARTLWLEKLVWELTNSGENDDLSIADFPDDNCNYWFSSSVNGESFARLQDSSISKSIKVYWSVKFMPDDLSVAWVSEKRGFGFFAREAMDLTLVAPIAERSWITEIFRAHSKPTIYCKLQQKSEGAQVDVVRSFRFASDRRSFVRDEAR